MTTSGKTGAVAFSLYLELSKSHKLLLKQLQEEYPHESLGELADRANSLSALATCPTKITPELLRTLGFIQAKKLMNTEVDTLESSTQLTPTAIRRQLEARHNKIQGWIDDFMEKDSITSSDLKVFQAFSQIDDKLVAHLLVLMEDDAAPLLAMAYIVACMRQQGVPEDEIKFVKSI